MSDPFLNPEFKAEADKVLLSRGRGISKGEAIRMPRHIKTPQQAIEWLEKERGIKLANDIEPPILA